MAYSKNRRLADLVATDGTMDAAKLKTGTVTQAHLHSSHGITTAHITEGSNKYYTDERVDDRSNSLLQDGANITLTYNDSAGTLTVAATDTNTTYSAGTGLALSSTTFSLSHLGLQSLSDPNADRIAFWDDSAGAFAWLTVGSNLTLSGTTLSGVAAYGDSDVDSHLSGGTGVTYSSGTISIGQAVATSSNVTFGNVAATGNVTVTGNLTVNGTSTTLSTATLDVEDKNITLNKGSGDTSASADGAGITIQDAVDSSTDATLLWTASDDRFNLSHPLSIVNNSVSTDTLYLESTEASSSAGPILAFKRHSSSPADADYLGQLKFKGENDADQDVVYAKITSKIQDASDGSEDGLLEFANRKAGSNVITARLRSDSLQLLNGTSLVVAGLTYPTSDGSNGQFLKTDGSGGLSFATPTDTNTTYSAGTGISLSGTTFSTNDGAIVHDNLSGFVANEHIDWTADQGGTNIHAGNYTNTTYSVGDGGLTQNNFTNTLKSKLDGIEASATADQSAAEILTAIKTVDGASSGLDADLLDGQEGSYYAAASGNATQSWVSSQGYATSAASLTGSNSFTNSYNEFGNNTGAVSNDGSWHARVNISGTSHARMDLFEDGDDSKLYLSVHSGYAGRIGMLSNTDLEFLTNGSVRGKIDNTGYWQINAHTNSWDGGLRMISQDGTDTFQIHPDNNGYMYVDKTWNFSNAPHVGIGNAVWHSGNDGSGSGLDADLLDGYQLNTGRANVANRVVATDSNGYIQAGWINSTSGDLGNTLPDRIYTSNDGYIRYADLATFRTLMHASAKTGYQGREQSTTDANYWIGSMGWSSTDFNTVFRYGSGFIDGWSTPANTPSGTSHWVGFNALHYTNGSSDYGWQMVMGAGTNGLLFVKGKWNSAGSWAKVWNADNDGSGSGLDADLLDGMNAAINGASTIHKIHSNGYSLLQNWQDVAGSGIYSSSTNGAHLYPNTASSYGTWRMNGSRNGYSGMYHNNGGGVVSGMYDSGGSGGDYREAGGGWYFYHNRSNACLGINASTTSSSYGAYVTGALYATGDIVGSSDERLKKNIQVIDNGLEKVLALRGVTYEWINPENDSGNNVTPERMGVIAQEILDIVPEVVTHDKENDRYGVDYGHLTGVLIEAIKDLNKKVEDLEKKLEEK